MQLTEAGFGMPTATARPPSLTDALADADAVPDLEVEVMLDEELVPVVQAAAARPTAARTRVRTIRIEDSRNGRGTGKAPAIRATPMKEGRLFAGPR